MIITRIEIDTVELYSMSTLTFSLSLSLPLLLLALPCRWPSSQFPQHTPVKSWHSSTVPLRGWPACKLLQLTGVKGLKKDKTLISYLDQFLELGVFFRVRINHSAFLILLCSSKRGNLSEIHFKCALQQLHTMKGQLMEKWQCLLILSPRGCPMTPVSGNFSDTQKNSTAPLP